MTIAVVVHGAAGRMGRAVMGEVLGNPQLKLHGAIDHSGSSALGVDTGTLIGEAPNGIRVVDSLDCLAGAEVVVDFSSPAASEALFARCAVLRLPVVVGTTGFAAPGQAALSALHKVTPVVVSPNFSVGVNVLFHLAERAVALLGPDFDAEIVEMHHRHKVDAPSGTAVRLADVVLGAKGLTRESLVPGRNGQVGARPKDEVGVMTLRGGDVVGDHTLILAGPGERLELTHRAHDRSLFARGAVRAAAWIVGRPAGLYGMPDVLGLASSAGG